MALRNQPYIPLYVQDLMTDEKLNNCCAATHGIYIKGIMCLMHKSESYGKILLQQKFKQTDKQSKNFAIMLVKHLPYTIDEIEKAIDELIDEKVCYFDGDFICQKRMIKDGEISDIRAKSGGKGGKKTKENNDKNKNNLPQQNNKQKQEQNMQQNTEYESKNEIVNDFNSNSIDTNIPQKPKKYENPTSVSDNDLENVAKTLNISGLDYDSKKKRLTFFKEHFMQLSETEKKDFCNGHRMLLERLEQALNNFNTYLLSEKNSFPFTYPFYKEWFNSWLKGLSTAEFDIYMTRIRRN